MRGWSIPLGRWMGVEMRVHIFFPLLLLVLFAISGQDGWPRGLALFLFLVAAWWCVRRRGCWWRRGWDCGCGRCCCCRLAGCLPTPIPEPGNCQPGRRTVCHGAVRDRWQTGVRRSLRCGHPGRERQCAAVRSAADHPRTLVAQHGVDAGSSWACCTFCRLIRWIADG